MGYGIDLDFFKTDPKYLKWEKEAREGVLLVVAKDGYEAVVYTPELYYIITNRMPVKRSEMGNTDLVKGKPLIDIYLNGYREGRAYFAANYAVSPTALYTSPAWINTIDHFYKHDPDPKRTRNGWEYYIIRVPLRFDDQKIYDYGYYAGVIYELELLRALHPLVFQSLANNVKSQNQAKATKFTVPQVALINIYEGNLVTRENAKELAGRYGHDSGNNLYNNYSKLSKMDRRIGHAYLYSQKKVENRIKDIQSILSKLSGKALTRAQDELSILQTLLNDNYL